MLLIILLSNVAFPLLLLVINASAIRIQHLSTCNSIVHACIQVLNSVDFMIQYTLYCISIHYAIEWYL